MYKNNLWRAVLALFQSSSLYLFLLNLDRLGNALCGGHYRFTVSGRVGYFARRKSKYWRFLQWVIDQTFYPIDGKRHCFKAYVWEKWVRDNHPKNRYRRGNDVALFLLSLLVLIACALLALPILIISLITS